MGSKQINISFTDEQVAKYNGEGYVLCFTAGVAGNTEFNVVATADTISPVFNITWEDQFQIAATKDEFSNGVTFQNSTTPTPIQFNEVYTLPANWTDGIVSTDVLPTANSFAFVNQTTGASAVVYKIINGKSLPFFISPYPIDTGATEVMTPQSTVALWFQQNVETGTMVAVVKDELSTFDFSDKSSLDLIWNGSQFVPSS
ncbi:hypothetical protein J7337_006475 [Fusarium musae]|uniref:Uncharacterized protein n=1 Tax=Fusarium musae TaxID=1042133 RepID=A0A9P8IPE8_9HYPO|nr:hypothetical protein J7337_006475 [Fusarium musae]KAG9500795.1 hypothetical protein J7337_006475 [Fusarium musae]